jgi:uncharacterized protein
MHHAQALAVGALALLSFFGSQPTMAQGPSFSCDQASKADERLICSNRALAADDRLMAQLFAAARRSAPLGAIGNGHLAAQRQWLAQRARCADSGVLDTARLGECLHRAYDERILQLATGALFVDRGLAVQALRAKHPQGAPLVEAFTRYAAQPIGSDWRGPGLRPERDAITTLVGGHFRRLQTDAMLDVRRQILQDLGVRSLEDAFHSDERFASTILVLATNLEEGPARLLVPCEALVRHPALGQVEESVYGSSLDGFIPESDCASSLPPSPKLDVLSGAIWARWPPCEGSIRYASYTYHSAMMNQARLGQLPASKATSRPLPSVRGVSLAVIREAEEELVKRYRDFRGYDSETAASTARERLRDLLANAHGCGD